MTGGALTTWTVIVVLAIGTFLIRYSFIGLIGNRPLPLWVLRHLRYTGVAILPAIVTPLVLFPAATGGEPDAARLLAAVVTVLGSAVTRSILGGVLLGGSALYLGLWLF